MYAEMLWRLKGELWMSNDDGYKLICLCEPTFRPVYYSIIMIIMI